MALKECPEECPSGDGGTLAGGGPLACRYTCGHVFPRGGDKPISGPEDTGSDNVKQGSGVFSDKEIKQGFRKV